MDGEAASGLALDMEVEVGFMVWQRKLETRKLRGQAGRYRRLNFLLQFFAGRRLKRWDIGSAGPRDKSAFGLGLDAINELRDEALKLHVARL